MRLKANRILSFLLLLSSTFSLAQQPAFRNYSVDDGLPSSEVYHIMQDSRGYIWMATNMGVSRFDGRDFINYDVQNGLPENTVFEIFEDETGRLWFISFPFQLSYYKNDSIHPYKFNDKLKELAGHGL
ncbi:MAG TPA: two-component regulator propeller domain-containing protein, partial [Lentimicrobium sp.]|nr:two-component regulator propeller domain-containing protein [Lentimicrobium sp.]